MVTECAYVWVWVCVWIVFKLNAAFCLYWKHIDTISNLNVSQFCIHMTQRHLLLVKSFFFPQPIFGVREQTHTLKHTYERKKSLTLKTWNHCKYCEQFFFFARFPSWFMAESIERQFAASPLLPSIVVADTATVCWCCFYCCCCCWLWWSRCYCGTSAFFCHFQFAVIILDCMPHEPRLPRKAHTHTPHPNEKLF